MTTLWGRGVLAGLLVCGLVLGCGGGSAKAPSKKKPTARKKIKARAVARKIGPEAVPPEFETVPCRIYTPEPGFLVIVDGVEAKAESGGPLLTPCEVDLRDGARELMLVKEKHEDLAQTIIVTSSEDFEFKPAFQPFTTPKGYLSSRYVKAKVGETVPLVNLNAGGAISDPCLSADGKTLFFVADRKEGRAVYVARREQTFQDFGEPEIVRATRGADIPCSPSVSEEGLLVYLALDNARVIGVEAEGDSFGAKRELKTGTEKEVWLSAQISADGLTLTCVREINDTAATYVTSRDALGDDFTEKWIRDDTPGVHPVTTSDGLRQFLFDGTTVERCSRERPLADWSETKVVMEPDVKMIRDETRRQFCVSDDEQWLFYVDDPEYGNLYALRLSDGPRWGFVPRGRSVPPKAMNVATTDNDDPDSPKPEKTSDAPEVDPRTRPLPYAAFRAALETLVLSWKFVDAEMLVETALTDPKHEKDREILGWDREDVKSAREFTEDVVKGIAQLKLGDDIRIGIGKAKFEKFENKIVHGKDGAEPVSKPIHELSPGELTSLAERGGEKTKEAFHLRVAAYLSFLPKISASTISSRALRAGVNGRAFQTRQARRKLHRIEQEIARENLALALELIDEVAGKNSRSETAVEALRLRESLFTRTAWELIGGRAWNTSTPGEYVAGDPKGPLEGAYLLSPREYTNFHLSLEWKTEGGPASQGGVYFCYTRGREIRDNAYKLHVANDASGPLDKFATGSLLGEVPPKARAVKPEGQWNMLVMTVRDGQLQATINGVSVQDTPLANPALPKSGYVALDGGFVGITYRKILLYELLPEK